MRVQMIAGALLLLASAGAASSLPVSERERLRQQAEHVCYNDVQKLCSDETSDEAKTAACMKAHRTQLSPACRKAFEAGMK